MLGTPVDEPFLIFTNLHAQRTPSQLGTEFSFSKSDAFGLRYNTQYIHQAPPQARRQNRKCDNKSPPFQGIEERLAYGIIVWVARRRKGLSAVQFFQMRAESI